MAIYYVWSGAAGSGNGSSWANAFTTLTLAFVTEVAGDTLYVAHDHSESTGVALALTSNGTLANPTKVICVNRAGTVPPVAADRRTTAQVATTGNITISFNNFTHWDGIIFVAGNSTGTASITLVQSTQSWHRLDNCSLRLGGTGTSSRIALTGAASLIELNNTTVSFSVAGQGIEVGSTLKWRDTPSALLGAAVPTTLFIPEAGSGGEIECVGVDLSAAGSGKTLFGTLGNAEAHQYRLLDCKLDAAVTKSAVPTVPGSTTIDIVRSSATGNYSVYRHRIGGTLEHETTIVRTGGASDGTTPIAWKIVTTANCNYSASFECPPIAIWNDTTGSAVTATIEGIAATLPTDAEVWLDLEYLGSGSSPQASFVNDGKPDLITTAVNQTSSSETWGGSTAAFKMAVTFTAQQAGWIYARVKVGKASSTVYLDPLVVLT